MRFAVCPLVFICVYFLTLISSFKKSSVTLGFAVLSLGLLVQIHPKMIYNLPSITLK